jgi:2-amino-4-hydroxy-6-hydroxymethyldihydropteridine diphosphokinase
MARALVGLGANIGDPAAQVAWAAGELSRLAGTRLVRLSSLFRTGPVGYAEQPDFVNAVALLDTALTPRALLDALLGTERAAGRARTFANAPRVLDLDLLLYDDQVIDAPGLTVPHPRMHERAFVLVPLVEIVPEIFIPGRGRAADVLRGLPEQAVRKLDER